MTKTLTDELRQAGDPALAEHYRRFFKTAPGEYGEGDVFIGLKVPQIRKITLKYAADYRLKDIETLLADPYHEIRLAALMLMMKRFEKADKDEQRQLFELYLRRLPFINNWDLVDMAAPAVVGAYCYPDAAPLRKLADSGHLWSERTAMVSCLYFIRRNHCNPAFELAAFFLNHPHELMHKACGWMLREAGKRNEAELCRFLDKHCTQMPRTMLRYALEKLSPEQKKFYMSRKTLDW